ncbi:MAG: hypothetical protein RL497_2840, partial [Pseudomonadota bacterium]
RLECVIREKPTPANTPKDCDLISELKSYLTQQSNQASNINADFISRLLDDNYRLRFFSLYHNHSIFRETPLNIESFNDIAIKLLLKRKMFLEWDFFAHTKSITRQNAHKYLTATLTALESNSIAMAATLLVGCEIAKHAYTTADRPLINSLWDNLLDCLATPERLTKQVEEYNSSHNNETFEGSPYNAIGAVIERITHLKYGKLSEDALKELIESVFTLENLTTKKKLYKNLFMYALETKAHESGLNNKHPEIISRIKLNFEFIIEGNHQT